MVPKPDTTRVKNEAQSIVKIEKVIKKETQSGKRKPRTVKKRTKPRRQEPPNWKRQWELIEKARAEYECPVDTTGAESISKAKEGPAFRYQTLVGLLLSSRTKDPVTAAAMSRLHELGGEDGLTLETVLEAPESQLAETIKPVGFWRQKASYMKRCATQLQERHAGDVPRTLKEIMALTGIGRKMGVLALQICWGQRAGVSADTHVTRLAQRLGWAGSLAIEASPTQVSLDIEDWLPHDRWRPVNPLLVGWGQVVCKGQHPKCGECPLSSAGLCPWFLK
eukprot:gnl/Dysnectes_brevis/2071_a2394_979.p3 GENE.gnl/Dysnectes_brevis/2071_a2394_979~~gnl/Dysnectes_brevis/2071_a2394_979.p3  ORF type:complete len:279 (-),score=93.19 gnl/Dysnectes_brevis/2071_a2394_979:155-991(-)